MLEKKYQFTQSFWFIPNIYLLVAVVLAAITVTADYKLAGHSFPSYFLTPIDLAIQVLATLAVGILTMTTITFSSIMVVLTTYSQQFSPRVLQNFIADKITHHVIALFGGGFVYTLVALLFMNKTVLQNVVVTPVIAVIWGIVALITFIYFIHHTAIWAQVNNLISQITLRTRETIIRTIKLVDDHGSSDKDQFEPGEHSDDDCKILYANNPGYIVYVNIEGLIEAAKQNGALVRLEQPVGGYLISGIRLMTIQHVKDSDYDTDVYHSMVQIADEQRDWLDIDFGIQKLAEIAVRAISPAINDPYTAVNCINRLSSVLALLLDKDRYMHCFADEEGVMRLVIPVKRFEDYLYKAFHEIRYYGCSDVSVMAAMLKGLALVAEVGKDKHRHDLWDFGIAARDGFDETVLLAMDKSYLNHCLRKLALATGYGDVYAERYESLSGMQR